MYQILVYPLISPVVNGFEFLIFNLGRISISIKFEFYLEISTLAHSLTHIKKIPPNINCCVVLFDKNEKIKTNLQFNRVTSLCNQPVQPRASIRNEIQYLYLSLMPVFHLKITVPLEQRVRLTQSRRFCGLAFFLRLSGLDWYYSWIE